MNSQVLMIIVASALFLIGSLFFWMSKIDEEPSFDAPFISSTGKSFIGAVMWLTAIMILATAFFYTKF